MKITCYIIDDEPLAIEVLESHIEKVDRLVITGAFQNAVEAFQELQSNPVDLLFLDIQMPGLTGIEFLESISDPPLVIFTTAYREYALKGFELDVVDYLLKPISFDRFLKSIGKVMDQLSSQGRSPDSVEESDDGKALYVEVDKKKIRVQLNEIRYIESRKDRVRIVTDSGEITARQKISYLEERLQPEGFIRIHRSFIVSVDGIKSWSSTEIEVPGETLPVGRTYRKEVLRFLDSHSDIL